MPLLYQLFDVGDLKNLDPKELDILKDRIRPEIRTNEDIRSVLLRKAHDVYSRLQPGTSPRGLAQP